MIRRILTIGLVFAVSACAGLPDPREVELPVTPPETFADLPAGFSVEQAWWESFGDPLLTGLVREALAQNPSLDEARARLDAAFAAARISGADLLPKVSGAAGRARAAQYIGGQSDFFPDTVTSTNYGISLNVSWEIDFWGRIRAGRAAAIEDIGVGQELIRATALSIAAQTAKAYFGVVHARRQLAVAEENRASAEQLAGVIGDRYEKGLRPALEWMLAKSEVAAAKASAALWSQALAVSLRQLEALAGRYPVGTVPAAQEFPAAPAPLAPGLPAEIVARRPDLRAAERALTASSYRLAEADAGLYPRVSLTGSGGLASTDLSDILTGDFKVWSLAANLLAPIFEGGKLRANVDLKAAREDEAAATFARLALLAFGEVEASLASERHLEDQESSLAEVATLSEQSLKLTEERYLAGLTEIFSVLEARRRLFTAKSLWIAVQRERFDVRVDLLTALGGGVPTTGAGK